MTDAELTQAIAELQEVVRCRCDEAYRDRGLHDPQCECDSAEAVKVVADRIKALTKERDDAVIKRAAWELEAKTQQARAEQLSDKLAKAVEALRFYAWENEMRLPSDGPWGAGSTDFGKVARTTLAEISSEAAPKTVHAWHEEEGSIMVGKMKGDNHE